MQTLQNTKNEYSKGNKGMAFIMFSQDPTAIEDISFEKFCLEMDKITQPSMQLQSVGWVPATPAAEIKVGNILIWNFGFTSKVVEVTKENEKSIWIKEESTDSGKVYSRRFLKTRLVAIK